MGIKPWTEADLVWFFGEGAARFERSPEGARLDAAAQFGFDSGGGRIESLREHEARVWEARQRQCRRPAVTMEQAAADDIRAYLLDIGAYEDGAITAQPVHLSRGEGAGYVPDHSTLTRFARISRDLRRCSPEQRAALEAYHGEAGARWERAGVALGRIVCVMVLVPSGQAALAARWRRLRHADDGGAVDRLVAEIAHQGVSPTVDRRRLLDSAEHQARQLLAAAHAQFEAQR